MKHSVEPMQAITLFNYYYLDLRQIINIQLYHENPPHRAQLWQSTGRIYSLSLEDEITFYIDFYTGHMEKAHVMEGSPGARRVVG